MFYSPVRKKFLEKYPKLLQEAPLFDFHHKEGFELIDNLFAAHLSEIEEEREFYARLFKSYREGHLFLEVKEGESVPSHPSLVREKNRVYLKKNYECEKSFNAHLERLKQGGKPSLQDVSLIERVERNPLTLLVGGPGTGKSYQAKEVIRHFIEKGKRVIVAAPTGKAASLFREVCPAMTLHALVEEGKRRGTLLYDLIILDEASMIDGYLFTALFTLFPERSHLLIIGDPNQLPPIGVGHFFRDLVLKEKAHCHFLTTTYRAEEPELLRLWEKIQKEGWVEMKPMPSLEELAHRVLQGLRAPEETLLSSFNRHRLLTPFRKGFWGVDHLNDYMHKRAQEMHERKIPILITQNDSQTGLYNGDLGMLIGDYALFDKGRTLPAAQLPSYEYSYALSVHKSQGSEFEEVTLLLPEGSSLFGKELLYTAITRAKKRVLIYGDKKA